MATNQTERRAVRPAANGIRSAPFKQRAVEDDGSDGWTLDGYGAVFNRMTVIDSWEGVFREQIANRSMTKTFRENPPIVQFDHGRHPLIGSFPIAELKRAREEVDAELAPEGGAHIVANIFRHLFFEPLREALAAQAIKGMSFRFEVIREKWTYADGTAIKDDEELLSELRRTWSGELPEEELPIRTLQELRVPEMGPVVWPAYADTSVGVRDQVINLGELDNDPEQRIALARKLWAMPKSGVPQTQSQDDDEPQPTDERSAGEHLSESNDAPQITGDQPAGEHPSQPNNKRSNDYVLEAQLRELAKMTRKENSL